MLMNLFFIGGLSYARQIPRFRIREERARDFFKKGLYFHNSHQYVASREFFYKALDIQPFFHLARRYLGDSYYYSGEWNAALEQWEFLDNISDGAYPLVRQRSELLRFSFNRYKNPGDYVYLQSYDRAFWSEFPFKGPADIAWDLWIRLSAGTAEKVSTPSAFSNTVCDS